jgi:hypothetical protein
MIEPLVVIIGMVLVLIPVVIFVHYLMLHIKKKMHFDYHLELVREKKGNFGVCIAYLERMLFAMTIISLGVVLSEFFQNEYAINFFVISLLLYIIVKYFDIKNEK